MITVVGSGPAGVSCAWALLRRGQQVRILDAGVEIERDLAVRVESLGAKPHAEWQPGDTEFLRRGMAGSASGIPLKLAYGSSFAYDDPLHAASVTLSGVDVRPSFARGGLSNVWGAAVLPYAADDISDWPVSPADLAPYHRARHEFMPVASVHDALADSFPLHGECAAPMPRSRQADRFLGRLERNRGALAGAGVTFGQARLAVSAEPCIRCGLCLYGCPLHLIYNSAQTLQQMLANPNFEYQPGHIVEELREAAGEVRIRGKKAPSGEQFEVAAERVFLACGLLPTTRVLLSSLGAFDRELLIHDSQYFLIPLLQSKASPGVEHEPLHTLAQAFVEIRDPSLSPRTIHLQIYSYNDLLPDALGLAAKLPFVRGALLGRLLIAQGYLHSAESARIGAVLRRSEHGPRLELAAQPEPRPARIVRDVGRKLRGLRSETGTLPLTIATRLGLPGRGYHSGGSFPMSATPGEFQSDRFGRIRGFERVHAVDATILPSVPATTITYSIMANAYRIGATVTL